MLNEVKKGLGPFAKTMTVEDKQHNSGSLQDKKNPLMTYFVISSRILGTHLEESDKTGKKDKSLKDQSGNKGNDLASKALGSIKDFSHEETALRNIVKNRLMRTASLDRMSKDELLALKDESREMSLKIIKSFKGMKYVFPTVQDIKGRCDMIFNSIIHEHMFNQPNRESQRKDSELREELLMHPTTHTVKGTHQLGLHQGMSPPGSTATEQTTTSEGIVVQKEQKKKPNWSDMFLNVKKRIEELDRKLRDYEHVQNQKMEEAGISKGFTAANKRIAMLMHIENHREIQAETQNTNNNSTSTVMLSLDKKIDEVA